MKARGSRVAALVGDLETDNDARRLAASGAPVRQINTHGICHLDAEMIGKHLDGWEGVTLGGLDYLFIENVGNLVCPSSYDLGEKIRVALLSVTEGEDKPLKYPTLFNSADAAVITKMDIAEACGFDRELALRNINEIRPGDTHLRDLRQDRRGDGGVAGVLGGGAGCAIVFPGNTLEYLPCRQPQPPASNSTLNSNNVFSSSLRRAGAQRTGSCARPLSSM